MSISVGLAVWTLIAFQSGIDGEFVSFDDYQYVRDNPNVKSGLSGEGLWWAMTSLGANNWHPITWISLQLDCEIYGVFPRGFHLTNLLLHAVNTVLLFLVLRWMTEAVWPSAAVAAFFAVHPLHVESVAWVTERKDVLSTFFWLMTLLTYTGYAQRPNAIRYLLVLSCLTMGLMSKPMVVTLPCVLLLLDFWPLRRWVRRFRLIRSSRPRRIVLAETEQSGEQQAHERFLHNLRFLQRHCAFCLPSVIAIGDQRFGRRRAP